MKSTNYNSSQKAEQEKIQQAITYLDKKIQIAMKFSPPGKARTDSLESLKRKKIKLNEELTNLRKTSRSN